MDDKDEGFGEKPNEALYVGNGGTDLLRLHRNEARRRKEAWRREFVSEWFANCCIFEIYDYLKTQPKEEQDAMVRIAYELYGGGQATGMLLRELASFLGIDLDKDVITQEDLDNSERTEG